MCNIGIRMGGFYTQYSVHMYKWASVYFVIIIKFFILVFQVRGKEEDIIKRYTW